MYAGKNIVTLSPSFSSRDGKYSKSLAGRERHTPETPGPQDWASEQTANSTDRSRLPHGGHLGTEAILEWKTIKTLISMPRDRPCLSKEAGLEGEVGACQWMEATNRRRGDGVRQQGQPSHSRQTACCRYSQHSRTFTAFRPKHQQTSAAEGERHKAETQTTSGRVRVRGGEGCVHRADRGDRDREAREAGCGALCVMEEAARRRASERGKPGTHYSPPFEVTLPPPPEAKSHFSQHTQPRHAGNEPNNTFQMFPNESP